MLSKYRFVMCVGMIGQAGYHRRAVSECEDDAGALPRHHRPATEPPSETIEANQLYVSFSRDMNN